MDLLDRINKLVASMQARGVSPGEIRTAIVRFVHSPLVGLIVKATPTPMDDVVLAFLKEMFPAE